MKTFANFFIFAIAAMTLVAFEVQEVSAKVSKQSLFFVQAILTLKSNIPIYSLRVVR